MTVLLITVTLRGSSAADVPSPPTKMPTYWPASCPDDVVRDHGVVDQPAVDGIEPDRGGAGAHAEPVAVDRPGAAGADLDEVVVVAAAVRQRVIHVIGADHAAAEAVHGVGVVEVVERVVLDQDVGRERADAVRRRAVQERRAVNGGHAGRARGAKSIAAPAPPAPPSRYSARRDAVRESALISAGAPAGTRRGPSGAAAGPATARPEMTAPARPRA